MISAFPDDYLRIINLSNGVCNEDVVERFMPKSISVAKILYNVEKEKIMEWAQGLLGELLRRLEMDQNKVKLPIFKLTEIFNFSVLTYCSTH